MTTVYIAPTFGAGYQGFTTGGLPLNAGLIYTYIAGGTTPQATYTTSSGNVQNANPIVLGADGRTPAEVWLTAGTSYRFDVKDSLGNLIQTYDNLYGIANPAYVGIPWAIAGGTADALTATYTPANTSLTDGLILGVRASAANATTTPTFAPDGLTAHTITKRGGSALNPGDIPAALAETLLRYNLANTRWEILNPGVAFIPSGNLFSNVLSGDVALNNTANYFDGPSVAQGTVGTWFVCGQVTVTDTGSPLTAFARLWDGTVVIDSSAQDLYIATAKGTFSFSGYITNPAGNLRISVRDTAATTGKILFNASGNSKDSAIFAIRIA